MFNVILQFRCLFWILKCFGHLFVEFTFYAIVFEIVILLICQFLLLFELQQNYTNFRMFLLVTHVIIIIIIMENSNNNNQKVVQIPESQLNQLKQKAQVCGNRGKGKVGIKSTKGNEKRMGTGKGPTQVKQFKIKRRKKNANKQATDQSVLNSSTIRRLARRSGVRRISKDIYRHCRTSLRQFLNKLLRDTSTYAQHARRHTVKPIDVLYALKQQGRNLYGYHQGPL